MRFSTGTLLPPSGRCAGSRKSEGTTLEVFVDQTVLADAELAGDDHQPRAVGGIAERGRVQARLRVEVIRMDNIQFYNCSFLPFLSGQEVARPAYDLLGRLGRFGSAGEDGQRREVRTLERILDLAPLVLGEWD